MAIVNGYLELAILKDAMKIGDSTDDARLEAVIAAVSRKIDEETHRRFYAASETRYYTACRGDELLVDDLLSVTTLATDGNADRTYSTTWAATDYDLCPFNAALDGRPYTSLRTTPLGRYSFLAGAEKAVKIAGSFGYAAATPALVQEACLIQSMRIFMRPRAPFGLEGNAEFGLVRIVRLDPDVVAMLDPFVRRTVA